MGKTRYTARTIPRISLRDFASRIDDITAQLVHAASTDGFFALTDTGIAVAEIESMFRRSEAFFALPAAQKATVPWSPRNVGWERNAQVRPSTGTADLKESYQLQFGANMRDPDAWIADDILPGFQADARRFMDRSQHVSEMLMLCFARGLGFPDDYFVRAHDVARPEAQSVLRLIYYPEQDRDAPAREGYYRAGWFDAPPTPCCVVAADGHRTRKGPHADWDLLTLLYQRPGQSGLEICPGRESVTEFAMGDEWTKVEFAPGDIVCNIGDLLMSWSDDRFKSTFHRVKAPEDKEKDYWGPRYSMAFFNQPCWDCKIQGPDKKYPMVTGEEFNRNAMQRNFAALKAKVEAMEKEKAASDAEPTASASISVGA
ncbi:leucoanthocyanidin dioxygenase [Diplodia corticola]|uniref:Leucoanthocyanidin dioxygenase n=1 Tax=Diplodia corticola TaxID=236234 RepID=A0A1J9RN69_9PEZI|nr:leucoanthocyanidin dioxygenase [Diplodia corticola]OJD34003.1 leucoanthocyanidin dioxygenase [Diplodia corticola]